jgi:hypothetical protein
VRDTTSSIHRPHADDRQQIVEIMRHSACMAAGGLGLAELSQACETRLNP